MSVWPPSPKPSQSAEPGPGVKNFMPAIAWPVARSQVSTQPSRLADWTTLPSLEKWSAVTESACCAGKLGVGARVTGGGVGAGVGAIGRVALETGWTWPALV